jgi:5-methylcytosine-specific restriction endonuclease McrA
MGLPRYAYDLNNEIWHFLSTGRIKKNSNLINGQFNRFFENRSGVIKLANFLIWSFSVSEINYSSEYAKYYCNSEVACFDLLFHRCFIRLYEYDKFRGKEKIDTGSSFDKYRINWFVAWYRDDNGKLKKESVPSFTSKWFLKKAIKVNKDRSEREKGEFIERETFQKYSTRIYPSRNFPPKLRELIFKRDNYTCQNCGKNKENCLDSGLRLEAHHIRAYEDGGDTCYKNGQALCSECNMGIHATKKFTNLPN